MARIAWHPAFVQAIAVELADYQDVLTFESEHQLTAEPLKIDVLIIKKLKNVDIKKNIGRIFRTYNVVEYKSPTDRANIEPMEEMIMQKKKGYFSSEILDDYFLGKGIAIGEAKGKTIGESIGEARAILTVLRARFKKVPKETEKAILAMTDSVALESWTAYAATCASMQEFAAAVK